MPHIWFGPGIGTELLLAIGKAKNISAFYITFPTSFRYSEIPPLTFVPNTVESTLSTP